MRSLTRSERFVFTYLNFPLMISFYSSCISWHLNGIVPFSIEYRVTPALQISDLNPVCPRPLNTSGARYAGVPHWSWIISPGTCTIDTPKSHIFTLPDVSSKIFSSLMSQCKTLYSWQCFSPSKICLKMIFAISSVNLLHLLTYPKRSPPGHSSVTNIKCSSVSKVS